MVPDKGLILEILLTNSVFNFCLKFLVIFLEHSFLMNKLSLNQIKDISAEIMCAVGRISIPGGRIQSSLDFNIALDLHPVHLDNIQVQLQVMFCPIVADFAPRMHATQKGRAPDATNLKTFLTSIGDWALLAGLK